MREQPYENENNLQTLVERHPELLAGDQMNPASPRRWLLISREMSIPGDAEGAGRWSLDHLFVDQDGVPTLVEVKRSSDTRIRREVVGQMLDYAANGVIYWPAEVMRSRFEEGCRTRGEEPEDVIARFLAQEVERSQDAFWETVDSNLRSGKIRLVFLADQIPTELQRVVEFLNEQMTRVDVIAVELKQFVGQGIQTLVSRLIGQTAATKQKQTSGVEAEKEQIRKQFWTLLLSKSKKKTLLHGNISPTRWSSIWTTAGKPRLFYQYTIGQQKGRVTLNIDTESAEENARMFNVLGQNKASIEQLFGESLVWENKDGVRACNIFAECQGGIANPESEWPEIADTMVEKMIRLDASLKPYIAKL